MNIRIPGVGPQSPYVAFKDDKERKWALVSRDVRWVLIALLLKVSGFSTPQLSSLWKLLIGG